MTPHADTTVVERLLSDRVDLETSRRGYAVAVGLTAVAIAALAVPYDDPAVATARLAAVAVPVGFALFRLGRARSDRFARLLLLAGALFSLTTLAESSGSTLYSIGRVSVWLLEPILVFLILAFPHGRLDRPVHRRLAAATALLVATLYLPSALLAPFPEPTPWATCGSDCPANAFALTSSTTGAVEEVIRPLREVISVLLFAAVTVVVGWRARHEGPLVRLTLAPVVAVAMIRTLALAVFFVARASGGMSTVAEVFGWLFILSLPALTLACAAGLLAHRLFVADALERLTLSIGSRLSARELRTALADALRDPDLELRFHVRETPSGWVDEHGWPAAPPAAGPNRAVTRVTADGHVLAALVHDRELLEDGALLAGVSSYAATTLENRELVGQLRSSLTELTESRARLVTVADNERRKIERDLHDGAQQRLVALQIKLALLGDQIEFESPAGAQRLRGLEVEIGETLDEVRRFGRGLYPPILADRGLEDALHAVARTAPIPTTVDARLPHRYPREVESAVYFACVEALQNATKHARGATDVSIAMVGNGRLRFDVRDNGAGFDPERTPPHAGLTSMRDRVGALGGTMEIVSEPGKGTRVTGMIPSG